MVRGCRLSPKNGVLCSRYRRLLQAAHEIERGFDFLSIVGIAAAVVVDGPDYQGLAAEVLAQVDRMPVDPVQEPRYAPVIAETRVELWIVVPILRIVEHVETYAGRPAGGSFGFCGQRLRIEVLEPDIAIEERVLRSLRGDFPPPGVLGVPALQGIRGRGVTRARAMPALDPGYRAQDRDQAGTLF